MGVDIIWWGDDFSMDAGPLVSPDFFRKILVPRYAYMVGEAKKIDPQVKIAFHSDGKIDCEGQRGSIHQIARELKGVPCNGWEHWYYIDKETRQQIPIDNLRTLYRQEHIEKTTNSTEKK